MKLKCLIIVHVCVKNNTFVFAPIFRELQICLCTRPISLNYCSQICLYQILGR